MSLKSWSYITSAFKLHGYSLSRYNAFNVALLKNMHFQHDIIQMFLTTVPSKVVISEK